MQRFHLKIARQSQALRSLAPAYPNFKQSEDIRKYPAFNPHIHHAHMRSGQGYLSARRKALIGALIQLVAPTHDNQHRRYGRQALIIKRKLRLHVFPARHAGRCQAAADMQPALGDQHGQKRKQQRKHAKNGGQIQHPSAQRHPAEQAKDGYRQQRAAPAGHCAPGTGTLESSPSKICWADCPFMRASGVKIRRWESTGSAMRLTSSGNI